MNFCAGWKTHCSTNLRFFVLFCFSWNSDCFLLFCSSWRSLFFFKQDCLKYFRRWWLPLLNRFPIYAFIRSNFSCDKTQARIPNTTRRHSNRPPPPSCLLPPPVVNEPAALGWPQQQSSVWQRGVSRCMMGGTTSSSPGRGGAGSRNDQHPLLVWRWLVRPRPQPQA